MQLVKLSLAQGSIIKVLLYFEVFNHPLKKEEVLFFLESPIPQLDIEMAFGKLIEGNIIQQKKDFYLLNLEAVSIQRREIAEEQYIKKLKTAKRYGTIIAACPFVRGLCLSGTMSKGVMYPDSDIDYFIITAPNRVWLAKMLLLFFKKTILFNSYKNFCINYFIDTDHLGIEERNQFTATELATLLPIYGKEIYIDLINNNNWLKEYYPNFELKKNKPLISKKRFWIKRFLEKLLDNRLGNFLNICLMKISWKKYNREFSKQFTKEEMKVIFKSKAYVSKGHPNNYQKKLLEELTLKKKQFESSFGIGLF